MMPITTTTPLIWVFTAATVVFVTVGVLLVRHYRRADTNNPLGRAAARNRLERGLPLARRPSQLRSLLDRFKD